MTLRVAILGKRGRLGAALCRELAKEFAVVPLGREEIDLLDVRSHDLDKYNFDLLINAAAATNVDWCEQNRATAFVVNGRAVGSLGQYCAANGRRCIHVSTDYVFSGNQSVPYSETAPVEPLSAYGESKALGERLLLQASEQHLVIRLSWVFGPDKDSFLDSILDQASSHEQIQAVADKFSSPTYSLDLAQWIRPLLLDQPVGGILHLCNSGVCSWQEWGQHALTVATHCGVIFQAKEVLPIPMVSLSRFAAKRPIYTAMDTTRFSNLTGLRPRAWQSAVEDFVLRKFSKR